MKKSKAAPWRKRLDARLPSLGSRVSASVTPRGFPVFLCHKFHSTTSRHSFISFHFISYTPTMVRQAWSAGNLAIRRPSIKGLHRISSPNPALCRTWVDIFNNKVSNKNICTKFPENLLRVWWKYFQIISTIVMIKAENYMPSGLVRFGLWLLERTACCCKNIDLRICSEVIYCESDIAELVHTTKSQGNEPTFLSSAVRM